MLLVLNTASEVEMDYIGISNQKTFFQNIGKLDIGKYSILCTPSMNPLMISVVILSQYCE